MEFLCFLYCCYDIINIYQSILIFLMLISMQEVTHRCPQAYPNLHVKHFLRASSWPPLPRDVTDSRSATPLLRCGLFSITGGHYRADQIGVAFKWPRNNILVSASQTWIALSPDLFSIRRECYRADPNGVAFKWPRNNVPCVCIPNTDRVVHRSRYNLFSIGRECYRADWLGVAFKWPRNDVPRLCIPNADHAVMRSRHDLFSIGRECYRADCIGVAFKWPRNNVSRLCIPNEDRVVKRSRHDLFSIGREGYWENSRRVSLHNKLNCWPVIQFPHQDLKSVRIIREVFFRYFRCDGGRRKSGQIQVRHALWDDACIDCCKSAGIFCKRKHLVVSVLDNRRISMVLEKFPLSPRSHATNFGATRAFLMRIPSSVVKTALLTSIENCCTRSSELLRRHYSRPVQLGDDSTTDSKHTKEGDECSALFERSSQETHRFGGKMSRVRRCWISVQFS